MSYEGFEEHLCANGHLRIFDAFDSIIDEDMKCNCGAPFVFCHSVNQTNGVIAGDSSTVGYHFRIDTPAKFEICNLGHRHVIEEIRYKIPPTRRD
jgi:hypothetical protein